MRELELNKEIFEDIQGYTNMFMEVYDCDFDTMIELFKKVNDITNGR